MVLYKIKININISNTSIVQHVSQKKKKKKEQVYSVYGNVLCIYIIILYIGNYYAKVYKNSYRN